MGVTAVTAAEENTQNVQTLGEKRVRVSFNVSGDDYVSTLKLAGATNIDLINGAAAKPQWDDETTREFMRLKALAMTAAEESAMWAVKMATL